jgi:hypothetical protein
MVVSASNSIAATKSCFTIGQSITVTFHDASPRVGDWIGVIKSTANVFGSVSYPIFVFTCGTSSCSGAPSSSTLSMFSNLGAGTYKAVLLPSNSFTPKAVSTSFSVHSTCSPTRPAPTTPTRPVAKPVPRPVAKPVPRPVAKPVARPTGINLAAAQQALAQIDAQVAPLVQQDSTLLPQFLRLAFHDCHVKCDGKKGLTLDQEAYVACSQPQDHLARFLFRLY